MQRKTIVRRFGVLSVATLAVVLFALGIPRVCRNELVEEQVIQLCRGPSLTDPAVIAFGLLFLFGIGLEITRVSIGNTEIEFKPMDIPKNITTGLRPRIDSLKRIEPHKFTSISLIVAGIALTFPTSGAFLVIYYEMQEGSIEPVAYYASNTTSEENRYRTIAEAQSIKQLAIKSIKNQKSENYWSTPFPEVNTKLRQCFTNPVLGTNQHKGCLLAIALIDHGPNASISELAVNLHLRAAAESLSIIISSSDDVADGTHGSAE